MSHIAAGRWAHLLRPVPLAIAGALALLLAGTAGGGIVYLATRAPGASATTCSATTIAENVLPTVVTLSVSGAGGSGSGSGEVIRDDGYILTNDHVISAAASGGTVEVLFSNGHTEPATLVGRSQRLDLAVIKVTMADKLPTITYGDSESLVVGQPVVALGAPLGLDGTVTAGIVSALGRDVPVPTDTDDLALLPGAIQTDASINPGNSGGALVDCGGRLVGVNTAIATVPNSAGQPGGGSVGIGFAIPVDLARIVADELIANGRFEGPYFGATTLPIPPSAASKFGVSGGLFVQAVSPDGPAAKAGLQPGDIITDVDGQAATGPDSLWISTLKKKPGDQLEVRYLRDEQPQTATVTLAPQPPG